MKKKLKREKKSGLSVIPATGFQPEFYNIEGSKSRLFLDMTKPKIQNIDPNKRIDILLKAGELLDDRSLDYNTSLIKVAQLITPSVADWCAIDILDEGGELRRLAVSHIDPQKVELAYRLNKEYPPTKDSSRGPYFVFATGNSELYPHIPIELIESLVQDERHKEIILGLGLRSLMIVPLKTKEKIVGVITFATSETEYSYTEEDVKFAEEVAKRAGIAVEISRLYTEAGILNSELKYQHEKIESIVSNIPGLVWEVFGKNSEKLIFYNNYLEELTGHPRQDWDSNPEFLFQIIDAGDRERVADEVATLFSGGIDKLNIQFRFISKNGDRIWVESQISTIKSDDGNIIGIRGVTIDITYRKKLDEKFRLAIESSPNAIVMVNNKGIIKLVNTETERIFGFRRSEMMDETVEMLMPTRFKNTHTNLRLDYLDHPQAMGRDVVGLRKDGTEFPVEISLNPINTDEGLLIISSIIDITERRKAEKLVNDSIKEKETLLKEIHHRVKNNMQIIYSLINLQLNTLSDPSSIEALRECQSRIRSMALIHEKLYSAESLSHIALGDYLNSLIEYLTSSYASGSNIIFKLNCIDIFIQIDMSITIGLVVNELLTNSLKHAFPEGKGTIEVNFYRDKQNYILEVKDDGKGMDLNLEDDANNPLGLLLVKNLVHQVNGVINVKSNGGTNFKITIPQEDEI